MTTTKNVIQDIVRHEIKSELIPTNIRLDEIVDILKNLTIEMKSVKDTVTDFAGDVREFDEEQTFMAHHVAKHSSHIENLEKQVFGQIIVDQL